MSSLQPVWPDGLNKKNAQSKNTLEGEKLLFWTNLKIHKKNFFLKFYPKAALRRAFYAFVHYMRLRFQSNYLGLGQPT